METKYILLIIGYLITIPVAVHSVRIKPECSYDEIELNDFKRIHLVCGIFWPLAFVGLLVLTAYMIIIGITKFVIMPLYNVVVYNNTKGKSVNENQPNVPNVVTSNNMSPDDNYKPLVED